MSQNDDKRTHTSPPGDSYPLRPTTLITETSEYPEDGQPRFSSNDSVESLGMESETKLDGGGDDGFDASSVGNMSPTTIPMEEGDMPWNSNQSSVFEPFTVATTSADLRTSTGDYSLNKLKFDNLGVHGRRKELLELESAIRRVAEKRKMGSGSFAAADSHFMVSENSFHDGSYYQAESQLQKREAQPSKKKELVLLSGYSGTGKSSLITSSTAANSTSAPSSSFISFEHLVKKELEGTLVMGKFDQILGGGSQQRPFTAFRILCEQLVPDIEAMKAKSIEAMKMKEETVDRSHESSIRARVRARASATARASDTSIPEFHSSTPTFDQFKQQISTELRTELVDLIQVFPALKVILANDDCDDDIQTNSNRNNRIYRSHGNSGRAMANDENPSERTDSFRKHIGTVGTESRNRFNFAFRTLIRILSKYLSPLVLVLDDLQWADAASLDLLETLISDYDNTNTMIVGIYRSNEVNETHLLSKMTRQVRSSATSGGDDRLNITEIEVGNLDVPAVSEVLQELLRMDNESRIWHLAELCHKKTGGNPFHLIHFVSMLFDVHLLEYNLDLMKWKWDIDEIKMATSATENVVDILKRQMTSLPAENQGLLQYASYLGSVFEERSIFVLWRDLLQNSQGSENFHDSSGQHDASRNSESKESGGMSALSNESISERLEDAILRCVEDGILEAVGAGTYRWVHDKLQEAALDLVPTDDRREFRQHVAEVLGSQLTDTELEASIFIVVDKFNEGIPPEDPSKRLELAELNLRAANKAVSYSAFESAASYCKYGIAMLPTDCWEKHYELSLELYSLGAETEGFMGNHPVIQSYCQEVLRQQRFGEGRKSSPSRLLDIHEKYRVYIVLIDSVATSESLQSAIDICLDVLKQYGTSFPRKRFDMTCRILFNMIKVKYNVKSRTEEEVQNLPMMTDPALVERMGVVDKLTSFCYVTRSPLFPLAMFKALHWTLRHGLSKYSPPVFATIGVMLGGVLGDLNGAATYAKYAMMLLSRLDPISAREVESRTRAVVHNFVLHWTQPARNMLKPLLRGYEMGLLSGDTQSACLCIYAYMLQSLVSGRSLVALEHDCRVYIAQIRTMNIIKMANNARMTWQVVLNLMGSDEHTTEIIGEALPQDIRKKEPEINPTFENILKVQESMLCGYFGDHERGAALAMERGNSFQKSNPGSALSTSDVFHRCLSLLAMARKRKEVGDASGLTRQMESKYMKSAKQSLSRIKKWVEQDNPNVRHYEALLDAEFAAYGDRPGIAKKFYETAANFAGRGGFLNDSALINERYGEYLVLCSEKERLTRGKVTVAGMVDSSDMYEEEAASRLKESVKYYREWGALAKVKLLEEQYERLLSMPTPTTEVALM